MKEEFTLLNGVKMPSLGLGTWLTEDGKAAAAVKSAINCGYRHIDTAQAYENERGVGQGVRECGLPRNEIFITDKVLAEIKNYGEAKRSIDDSLAALGTNYIDLMLIHCPQPWAEVGRDYRYFKENIEVWRALEEAYEDKKLRAIGVSNFLIEDMENIMQSCVVPPMVNQISISVGNTPTDVINFCKNNNIVVEAYSPIAHGAALKNEKVAFFAQKYGVSAARLCIKYALQLGTAPLPKSTDPAHIKENFDLDFTISEDDMEILRNM